MKFSSAGLQFTMTIGPRNSRGALAGYAACVFLCLVLLTGGSSRIDSVWLILLRPASFMFLGAGILLLSRRDILANLNLFVFGVACVALVALYLLPLPPTVWAAVPGRGIAIEIGRAAELGAVWRPLSLVPVETRDTLFALVSPLAILCLTVAMGPERQHWLVRVLLGGAGASVVLATLQVFYPDQSVFIHDMAGEYVASGLFGNRNHYGVFLALITPLLFHEVWQLKFQRGEMLIKFLLSIVSFSIIFLIVLAVGSRAGIVAFAFSALLTLGLLRMSVPISSPLRSWRGGIASGLFVTLAGVSLVLFAGRRLAVDRIGTAEGALATRDAIWQQAIGMIGETWPFGIGWGAFPNVYKIREPLEALTANYWNHVHNDWLETVLSAGALGLLALAVAVVSWAWTLVRLLQERPAKVSRRQRFLAFYGIGAAAILALASVVDYPLRTSSLLCIMTISAVWASNGVSRKRLAGSRDFG